MSTDQLKSALSVPPDITNNTKTLTASISSFQSVQSQLENTAMEISNLPQLKYLVQSYINPVIEASEQVQNSLMAIIAETSEFCQQAINLTHDQSVAIIDIYAASLSSSANNLSSLCNSTGGKLDAYHNQVNTTIADLNTIASKMDQENQAIKSQMIQLEARLRSFENAPWYDQILHAFEIAFGDLKQEIESEENRLSQEMRDLSMNQCALNALRVITSEMGNISSVTSALEISWRNLSDSIKNVGQDVTGIAPGELSSDMAYILSDWESLEEILKQINS